MSDDLKSRLRKFEGGDKYGSTVWCRNPDGPEAADRIVELEAALRESMSLNINYYEIEEKTGHEFTEAPAVINMARSALAGEKKDEK